ncbi:MAG: ferrous iron transport protein A [Patescibacteria group bacterium]|nr:ferrous iron transport protein A [Patescibacteria group bacterium]
MERTLNEMRPGEACTVKSIRGDGALKKRLLDMGFMRGTRVEVMKVAPLGDPVDIKVKGYHLSLRKQEAASVLVEVKNV